MQSLPEKITATQDREVEFQLTLKKRGAVFLCYRLEHSQFTHPSLLLACLSVSLRMVFFCTQGFSERLSYGK